MNFNPGFIPNPLEVTNCRDKFWEFLQQSEKNYIDPRSKPGNVHIWVYGTWVHYSRSLSLKDSEPYLNLNHRAFQSWSPCIGDIVLQPCPQSILTACLQSGRVQKDSAPGGRQAVSQNQLWAYDNVKWLPSLIQRNSLNCICKKKLAVLTLGKSLQQNLGLNFSSAFTSGATLIQLTDPPEPQFPKL